MNFLSGLSRGAVVVTATTVLGSSFAVTGVALSAPARAAAPIDTSSQSAFIRSIAPLAQEGQRAYGVPASVAIAQAILESGWGRSALTTRGNAFFGIKCSRTLGPYATGCINMRTREVFNGTPTYIVDGFRTYDDPADSFKDHGRFLTVNSRYRAAFNYPNDPKRFIAEVHKAGYATDPTYTAMIVRLMDQYNLYRFDVLPESSASATPSSSASATASPSPAATPTPTATPSETASASTPTPTATIPVPAATASTDWSPFGPPTASASSSPVPYAIPSPQVTPTLQESLEAVLPTPTPSPTAVATTANLASTPSAAPSTTATVTATPTSTVTATPTVTRTPTVAATPTVNATPTVTTTVTAAPTADVTLAAAAIAGATATPSATSSASVITTQSATATPTTSRTATAGAAVGSSRVTSPTPSGTPSASPSPSPTTRTPDAPAPISESSVTAPVEVGPQPMVGDGVVPDPSIEPNPESEVTPFGATEPRGAGSGATVPDHSPSPSPGRGSSAHSVAPTQHKHRAFDPEKVRAAQPQDPAKAGALHPDGTRVGVAGLRPQYDRHGGLAKTGW